jgi:hypothetical protein
MNATMTKEEVSRKVLDIFGESMAEVVMPDTPLLEDIGAREGLEMIGIDFLDMKFRLAKAFGIEISRGELFRQTGRVMEFDVPPGATVQYVVDYVCDKLVAPQVLDG